MPDENEPGYLFLEKPLIALSDEGQSVRLGTAKAEANLDVEQARTLHTWLGAWIARHTARERPGF